MEADGCRDLDDLFLRAARERVPLNVDLELTLRCNVRCVHCYNFDRGAARPAAEPELSFEEIVPLLDDLRAAGTLFLSLTGGEPMAHPRFWEVLEAAAGRGFAVTLKSNGTLLDANACRRLVDLGALWEVDLSLYGAQGSTHDAVTRAPGSFVRTLEGARRLAAGGVRVSLRFVLMKSNAGEAAAMMAMAEREGLEGTFETAVTGRYDGTVGSLQTRVETEGLEELYRGPLRSLLKKRPADPSDDEFKCACARANAAVSAAGDVYPCIATPLRAGNVREQPFSRVWKESPVFEWIRGLHVADFKSCAPCPLKAWCRRSPGPAYVLTGDFTGIDPWVCREADVIRKILW